MIFHNQKINEIFQTVESIVGSAGMVKGIIQRPTLLIISTFKLKENEDFRTYYTQIRAAVGEFDPPTMNVEPQNNGKTLVRITCSFNISEK